MMIRSSRYGKFMGCSGYPECKHIIQLPTEGEAGAEGEVEEMACPNCAKPMQKRKGRFGDFWGCTGYPECKTIVDPKRKDLPPPDPDFSMPCPRPKCGGTVTAKRSRRGTVFYGCDRYNAKPKCEYVAWSRPEPDKPCPECGYPQAEKVYRGHSQGLKCTNPDCVTLAGAAGTRPARGAAKGAAKSRAKPVAKTATAKRTTTRAKASTTVK